MPLALVHAVLWYWANHREGVWLQAPATDQAHDLRSAWLLFQAIKRLDPGAMVWTWAHASGVHTPLIPFVSAVLMVVFGESRVVAESVLPLSTAVWLLATYAVVGRLYDRETARWTTALVSCFPVLLIYSRTYLLEHPLAALFSCACWALLATDRFGTHCLPRAFGALAGLTALARGGGRFSSSGRCW